MSIVNFSYFDSFDSGFDKDQLFELKENGGKDVSSFFLSKQSKLIDRIDQLQGYLDLKKIEPDPTGNDTNGSYFLSLLNEKNEPKKHGVYKPSLQSRGALDRSGVPGVRKGIPPGSQSFRERLACALEQELHNYLAGLGHSFPRPLIPTTVLAAIKHDSFGENHRIGSYQRYKKDKSPLADASERDLEIVPLQEFFMLALMDCLFLNTDRHLNNLLCAKKWKPGSSILTLIDHGECFPEISSLDQISLEWRYLSFAKMTFSDLWVELIDRLDISQLTKRILVEVDEAKVKEKKVLTISGEAIAVFVYAVLSLQHFVRSFPERSISEYVEYLSVCSQFCVELPDPKISGQKMIVRLNSLTMPAATKEFRDRYGEVEDIEIRRKNFGGQFVSDCKGYWQDAKNRLFNGKSPSPQEVYQSLDRLSIIAKEKIEQ